LFKKVTQGSSLTEIIEIIDRGETAGLTGHSERTSVQNIIIYYIRKVTCVTSESCKIVQMIVVSQRVSHSSK